MTKQANKTPVGQDDWLAYLDEARRNASDLEQHVATLEKFKAATAAEPGSLAIWLAYCEYFHSLYLDALKATPTWSEVEVATGRDIFTLDSMLQQWQEGYDAVQYRLGDSHVLWDRWMELEMEQLMGTNMSDGVQRITRLYHARLQTPHVRWDDTSQRFSSFLSQHNRGAWEESMQEITKLAQDAKKMMAAREGFEFSLDKAERDNKVDARRAAMREYLDWEVQQRDSRNKKSDMAHAVCQALFNRALTVDFSTDESVWFDYVSYLSSRQSPQQPAQELLPVLQLAVERCPGSGQLWARYILTAEEAKLSFADVETIKHTATSNEALYKDGMTSLLDMYVGWCGFLKRWAMAPNATNEAADMASKGLSAAVDDVAHLGKRLYGKEFKGDPEFRLERIYVNYLSSNMDRETEHQARTKWNRLAKKPLYADRYDFWRAFYLWEMRIFFTSGNDQDSPASSPIDDGYDAMTPTKATAVMAHAISRRTLDWPERALDVYIQHCHDHETPAGLRRAMDDVHRTRKLVTLRRQREAAEAAFAYQEAQLLQQQQQQPQETASTEITGMESPSHAKRKRDGSPMASEPGTKRAKNGNEHDICSTVHHVEGREGQNGQMATDEADGRDREHTTVIITGLPDVTQTALKKYLKGYGHIKDMVIRKDDSDTAVAYVEFGTAQEAHDVITFKDNKYYQQNLIRVQSGARLTLFVTNYPPTADENFIRNLFEECGQVVAVRFPSLKFNTRRRFCYVMFKDTEASAKATQLDGKPVGGGGGGGGGRYKLQVAYSDPSRKKKRGGAVSDGRELFVRNLRGGTTEDELKAVFAKYGTVTSCRMRGSANPGKGIASAFVDFERKEDAERAMTELDKARLGTHIMTVELARDTVKISGKLTREDSEAPLPPSRPRGGDADGDVQVADEAAAEDVTAGGGGGDRRQRRMALMGLPDTVNEARVMALAETVGSVSQVTVQPVKGTAIVEFVDEATVGRALLKLDGHEIDGAVLKAGTLAHLGAHVRQVARQAAESEQRKNQKPKQQGAGAKKGGQDSMRLAPAMVRRPVLGKPGPKRGLGFVANKTAAGGGGGGGEGRSTTQKSNADFKAMFLGANDTAKGDAKDT